MRSRSMFVSLAVVVALAVGVPVGVVLADAVTDTYTGCLTSRGGISSVAVGTEPARDCRASDIEISWNSEGPAGSVGPPGESGAPADVQTFAAVLPRSSDTNLRTPLIEAAGFILSAQCHDDAMTAWVEHSTAQWKQPSLPPVPAGDLYQINTIGIVNDFGEGTMGRVNGFTTGSGSVFLASADNMFMAVLDGGESCVFAGAPHVQSSP